MKKTDWAEECWSSKAKHIFADLRLVPRLLVLLYGFICWKTWVWITAMPEPTTQQVAFATSIWAAAAAWFSFYNNTGSK